ncbi:hypothetical protein PRIPAC_80364 [Pristionchus pacificus]|uniref:Uncharacterized protein n=1 Tax=Pristionchus pacificus TaxID=54126 RepID=A0A2A6BI44_PRIPA|nr:hypothetical protein PRIPAC_80364 [Pristionchus pacificus]|eukprot:PDM65533.1 hypothetical protein PRIPAC_52475 [Pristionchus pacificus]
MYANSHYLSTILRLKLRYRRYAEVVSGAGTSLPVKGKDGEGDVMRGLGPAQWILAYERGEVRCSSVIGLNEILITGMNGCEGLGPAQ